MPRARENATHFGSKVQVAPPPALPAQWLTSPSSARSYRLSRRQLGRSSSFRQADERDSHGRVSEVRALAGGSPSRVGPCGEQQRETMRCGGKGCAKYAPSAMRAIGRRTVRRRANRRTPAATIGAKFCAPSRSARRDPIYRGRGQPSGAPCLRIHGTGSVVERRPWPTGRCTSKCRCGPDDWPLEPTRPILCPAVTCWPTDTSGRECRWQ